MIIVGNVEQSEEDKKMAALLRYKAGEGAVEKALIAKDPNKPFTNFGDAIEYIRTNRMYLYRSGGSVEWRSTDNMTEEERRRLLGSFETNPLLYIDFTLSGETLLNSLI
ncbi:MAG: hypothetical protein ACUVXI_05325 [bacterium]